MKNTVKRIVYISGPIKAESIYDQWLRKEHSSQYFGTIYLEQFFSVCQLIDAKLYTVTTLQERSEKISKNGNIFHNCPTPDQYSGLQYHVRCVWWFAKLIPPIIKFWPDVIVATAMQNYWFMLIIFKLFNIKLVSSLHCVVSPKFAKIKTSQRLLNVLNHAFYAFAVSEFMAVSSDVSKQLKEKYNISPDRIYEFIPTYRKERFESLELKDFNQKPFTIMFSGRIEENKGVYDLVKIGKMLEDYLPGKFVIHICGEGSVEEELKKMIREEGIEHVIKYHGYCSVSQQENFFLLSHIVIVPTKTTFEEGFNKVCAEAILSLRPVITSIVCPAINYIKDAAIEVSPDNVNEYYKAVLQLYTNNKFYQAKAEACFQEREKFFDSSRSYQSILFNVLKRVIS
jgi:glycogen synthase